MPSNPTKNMQECYYCQDGVEDAQAFTISAPDKTSVCVCSSCMDDLKKFFKSGEAEKNHLEPLVVPSMLGTSHNNRLVETQKGQIVKVFDNIVIQRLNLTKRPAGRIFDYQYDSPYDYNSRYPSKMDRLDMMNTRPFERHLELEAIILDD
jgi:hypothetical protein